MGMSIDDYILALTKERKTALHENKQAFDIAMNVMRKYQQIEQIYKEWFSDAGHTSAEAYRRIGEVIEDGNDD